MIAIASELHPRMLERKLKSFLTPSARHGQILSLARIKERLETKEKNMEKVSNIENVEVSEESI